MACQDGSQHRLGENFRPRGFARRARGARIAGTMRSQDAQSEAVRPGELHEALRFLVAGGRRDVAAAIRAEAFERMIERCGGQYWFRLARRAARYEAAALVVATPGRVGMVFYPPLHEPGIDRAGVARVVRESADLALAAGVSFVQAMIDPGQEADVDMLAAAGFQPLAELVYLRKDLRSWPVGDADLPLSWRNARKFDEAELRDVIRATYEQSLDCPGLYGLRELPDVIAGHKATGIFHPRTWWIAEMDGRPAGCILVNASSVTPGAMEVVYMGVVASFRGRGVGRAMLRRAARWARRRRKEVLTVAVDSENVYAKRLYDGEGFYETDRRLARILRPSAGVGERK